MSDKNDSLQDTAHQPKPKDEEEDSGISFDPPVYRQRYKVVREMIDKYKAQKVLDFGCAEAKLLRFLIRSENIKIERLVGVDIDGELLRENSRAIDPLISDWLSPRDTPLTVSILQGSISQADDRFTGFDLISCVEIIEHLVPEHLEMMPAVIFGQLSPKVVIVTTPNADFNVLFPNFKGFRHWDHKFEWTREEFEEWSSCQATKYNYKVTFQGIGKGPMGTEHLGCCSQMALFEKKETNQVLEKQPYGQPYQMIKQVEFPHRINNTSYEQQVTYEIERILWFLAQPNQYEETEANDGEDEETEANDGEDNEPKAYELVKLFEMGKLKELCNTLDNFRSVLQGSSLKLTTDGNAILYAPQTWDCESNDDYDNDWTETDNQSYNDEILKNSEDENWDTEDNNINLCWNSSENASVYWDGKKYDATQEDSYDDDPYSDSNDGMRCTLNNSYTGFKQDLEQHNDYDCDNDYDGLPWITTKENVNP